MTDSIQIVCANPECQIQDTGVCVEGHSPSDACPYYGGEQESQISLSNEEFIEPEETDSQHVKLHSGESLSVSEADKLLRSKSAKIVAVVGDRNSGKTTLIDSIYSQFLKGGFADCIFCGSQTILAFERDCFYSRIESGMSKPVTAHTSISEGLKFYHLSVLDLVNESSECDFLISDRAGETYTRARGQTEEVSSLIEISKADHVLLLLDGERLSIPSERSGAIQSVRQALRAFYDNGAIGKMSNIQIVKTKADLLQNCNDISTLEEQLNVFEEKLIRDFSSGLNSLDFCEVAARDPVGRLCPAFGVSKLLRAWIETKRPPVPLAQEAEIRPSQFDKLLLRTFERGLP